MEDGALSRALDEFAADGIATIEGVFTSSECAEMRSLLDAAIEDATEGPGRTWGGFPAEEQVVTDASGTTVFALWDTYERCQSLIPFTEHPSIIAFIEHALCGPAVRATSGTMFDKVETGDAQIGPHQDAFFQVVPTDGIESAATIDSPHAVNHLGVLHVHPQLITPFTEDLFLRCLTVRINIDMQTEESGCLRVLPSSHRQGPFEILSDDEALDKYVETHAAQEIVCESGEGSVTFYRPLLIHSSTAPAQTSSDSTSVGRRRVLAHRVRAADLEIPGWSWPTHWTGVVEPLRPADRWTEVSSQAMPGRL